MKLHTTQILALLLLLKHAVAIVLQWLSSDSVAAAIFLPWAAEAKVLLQACYMHYTALILLLLCCLCQLPQGCQDQGAGGTT